MGTNPGLHDDPAVADHLGLDRDFVAILISCFRHFEYGEDRRGNNKNCIIDKVTSRTNPLSNAIYQRQCRIISDAPVFVEETLGLKFLGVRVCLWVVQDRPGTS